jgi:hypothetical protein
MDDLMGIPLEDLLAEVEAHIKPPDPGQEYLSSAEWAVVWGVPPWRATKAIHQLCSTEPPMMEASERPAVDRRGRPYSQPVYKLLRAPQARG